MLPRSIAAQRFQSVAGRYQEIGKNLSAIEGDKSPKSYRGDIGELLYPLAPEQPLGLLAPEAPDHTFILTELYIVRQT